MPKFKFAILILIFLFFVETGYARAPLVLNEGTIGVTSLVPGMSGHMLTVIQGTEPSKIPVKIIAVVPQQGGSNLRNLILVRIRNDVKLAQGMSGSPVYFDGKLAGAVRSGWENSDQSLAFVTPIEEMLNLAEYEAEYEAGGRKLADVSISGLSASTPSILELSQKLGIKFIQGASSSPVKNSFNPEKPEKFKPGSAISVFLVW